MCGIAGIFYPQGEGQVEASLLESMAGLLAHRGPDDAGFHLARGLGLAHRRLSIIDLDRGHQPLYNEDGTVVLVGNGEIYNYADLTAELEGRGHRFRTGSDNETIVHAYEERGADCVTRLRGMFAFALWDQHLRRLILARDRLGIKPLYYFTRPGLLVFASEIKAILEHPAVPREVDPEALDLYLSLRYVPGPRTLFRGVHKLQPGHLLVADEAGVRTRKYWELPRGEVSVAEGKRAHRELVDRFTEEWEESVRLHLASDVPLGVFLSGGLDSTAVLASMSRVAPGQRFKSFNVGYETAGGEGGDANEDEFARLAAEALGSEHHEVRLGDEDFRDALARLVWHLDEPVADPACVPLYFISRRAREEITVVLSGEGADEILGGYGIYPRMLTLERAHQALAGAGGRGLTSLLHKAAGLVPGERLRHYARLTALPLAARYQGVSRAFLPETKARLLGHGDSGRAGGALRGLLADRYAATEGETPLSRMLHLDTTTWLPDDLLVKADKMTMANSQELRVPFLDHRIVELAATLPSAAKVRGGTGKMLLREAMEGQVPEPILRRAKKGFPVPTVPLLRNLEGLTRELLLDPGSACRSWFDGATVERLLDEHQRGAVARDQEIWSLLVFELWHRTFIDRRLDPAPARKPNSHEAALAASVESVPARAAADGWASRHAQRPAAHVPSIDASLTDFPRTEEVP